MEDGFKLQDSRIAIIGLGLMGGSLALALKGKCAALYGIDSDPATVELALAKGIVDQADIDPARLRVLPAVDLVILATPVPAIISFIQHVPSLLEQPCIILDIGSTKRDVLQAMKDLPGRFDPVGGHPICGKEKPGLENAEATLYKAAPFVVTALKRTTLRARSAVQQIVAALGATLIEMTAEEHDRILAHTSNLPFLLSSLLVLSTPLECIPFIGPGFRSTSRLAGTSSHMTMGILQTNRDNVLNAIMSFRNSLNAIETALQEQDDAQLESILHRSRSAYQLLVSNY